MRGVLVVLSSCGALLAGCGGEAPPANPEERARANASDASREPAEGDVTVVMQDNEFVPADVAVDAGETVVWVNRGEAQHNAVASQGEGPASELFNPGGSYAWTAGRPGTIRYVCTIHPGMEGTITVR